MATNVYTYPTSEQSTDALERAADRQKLIRESAMITAMLAFDWTRCLDFGTGTGRYLPVIDAANPQTPKKTIVAYDIDAGRIAGAQAATGHLGHVTYHAGTLDTLDGALADASLDCVLCCQVVGHVSRESFARIFAFFAAKLRRGGKLVLCLPFHESSDETDFYHRVHVDKPRDPSINFREMCSASAFDAATVAAPPGMLPVRAFGIVPFAATADNADLPLATGAPQALRALAGWRIVSSQVYSIHDRIGEDKRAIGDLILKLERA